MGPVLSASSVHGRKKELYVFAIFMERANEQDHCLILWNVRSVTIQVFFRTLCIDNLETEKSVVMATLVDSYC